MNAPSGQIGLVLRLSLTGLPGSPKGASFTTGVLFALYILYLDNTFY